MPALSDIHLPPPMDEELPPPPDDDPPPEPEAAQEKMSRTVSTILQAPEVDLEKLKIVSADDQQVKSEALELADRARAIEVTDPASYKQANEWIEILAAMEKRVEEKLGPRIKLADQLHSSLCELRNEWVGPVKAAREILRSRGGRWYAAERERERVEKQQREEQARQAEQQRLALEARAAEQAGDTNTATIIREEAKTVPTPHVEVQSRIPDDVGATARDNWKGELTDLRAFIQGWLDGRIPRTVLDCDVVREAITRVLSAEAKRRKEEMNERDANGPKWPGVRAFNDVKLARTGRR